MNDSLLKELGKLARSQEEAERARLDERWDRLAAGTLTAEEEAELRALADTSPEAREAYAAFQPLGADFQARVVNEINKVIAINSEREAEARVEPQEEKPGADDVVRKVDNVLAFRRVVRWFGAAAAVAAGLYFLVPSPISSHYEIKLSGLQEDRGGETAPPDEKPVFGPGSAFNPEIGPKLPLEHPGEVKTRAFLSSSGGREDLQSLGLEDKFESAETGSVHLRPKATITIGKDIKVSPGDWIFWTVVTRGFLPEAPDVQARLRAKWPQHSSWQEICDALQKEELPDTTRSQVACVEFRVVD